VCAPCLGSFAKYFVFNVKPTFIMYFELLVCYVSATVFSFRVIYCDCKYDDWFSLSVSFKYPCFSNTTMSVQASGQ
jgi:hypothetical protein